jgi:hypothetical protein
MAGSASEAAVIGLGSFAREMGHSGSMDVIVLEMNARYLCPLSILGVRLDIGSCPAFS